MLDYVKIIVTGLIAVAAAIAANYARDLAYMVHALIICGVAAGLFIWSVRTTWETKPAPELNAEGYLDGVVRYGVIATSEPGPNTPTVA